MTISNVLNKLKNKHFLSLAGNVTMSGLGVVTVALLTRAISLDQFGVWVFFQSVLLLIDTFRSGFLTTAFIKFYAGTDAIKAKTVIGSCWYIAIAITAILTVANALGLLFVDKIDNAGLKLFFNWFSVFYWAMLPYFMATCIVQAEQRFDRLLYLRFMNQGLFIVCVITLIFLKRINIETVAYSYLISYAVPSVIVMLNGWSGISNLGKRTSEGIKELYHFGKFSVGTTLSSNLFRTSDTFIINFMLGPAALAIYNIGQRLMEVVEIPLRSFAATGMPALSAAYNQNKKQEVINIMKKYTGMLTVALIPVCIVAVLLADFAIGLIGGGKYIGTQAPNVFRLFMTFALLYPADRFLALTLDVIHKPQINFIKVLIMLAVNVITDFAGIYIFGNIYGVAIATIFPILIGVIVGYVALGKYQYFSFWKIYSSGYQELKMLINQFLYKKKLARV